MANDLKNLILFACLLACSFLPCFLLSLYTILQIERAISSGGSAHFHVLIFPQGCYNRSGWAAWQRRGLLACYFNLEPCMSELSLCSHLHSAAAADGALELVVVADSDMSQVKHSSTTCHYFPCHQPCQFRFQLD